MTASPLAQTPNDMFNAPIAEADPEIAEVLNAELSRQQNGLEMIASENFVPRAVLQAQGSVLTNKYAEGYPGRRYYGGCEQVDRIETIARERAKSLFGAEYVNVQPHSGAQANAAVYQALVKPGDTVLDMGTGSGILAIAAAMLGAEVRTVVDIDENCLRTAQENAEKNHVSIGRGLCGDALRDEKLAADIGSGYSVIVANIVADVIIGMAPMFFAKTAEGGTLICSGILNERADEVRAALEKAGFEVVNHAKSDDWSAFTAKK